MRRRFDDEERTLGLEGTSAEDLLFAGFDNEGMVRGTGARVRARFISAGFGLNTSSSELETKSSLRFFRGTSLLVVLEAAPEACGWTRRFIVVFALDIVRRTSTNLLEPTEPLPKVFCADLDGLSGPSKITMESLVLETDT
jgi:hypothetical protein